MRQGRPPNPKAPPDMPDLILSRPTKVAALVTLLGSLLFPILAVIVGLEGNVVLSNALVAATEAAMLLFAVVNLQAHRRGTTLGAAPGST